MDRYFLALLFAGIAAGQPVLRFKGRPIENTAKEPVAELRSPVLASRGHLVLQFETGPDADVVAALRSRGVAVLSDFPENGLIVSLEARVDVRDLGIRFAAPIAAENKISSLARPGFNLVEFHPDADPNSARALLLARGIELRENPDLRPNHLLVNLDASQIAALADLDPVAYIFPASDDLVNAVPTRGCAGALTVNGAAAQSIPTFGDGWDGPGLGSATLSYVFSKMTGKLDPAAAQAEILRAMAEWSKAVRVTWQPGSGAAGPKTVNILFASGDHGDGFPFDGPGGVLAHTFYPAPPNPEPIAGDMHFDDSESWRIGANTDLFSVALHELGHALGLGHADSPTAVMYPYYKMATGLSALDIATVRTLYAAQTAGPSTPGPIPPPAPTPTPVPLVLVVNQPPSTTPSSSIGITGAVSGGTGNVVVSYATDHGQSGLAQGSASWSIAAIALSTGPNTITITASDAATHVAQSYVVTRTASTATPVPSAPTAPKPGDTTPPTLAVTSPAATVVSTSAPSITFSGAASDNVGVASVTWSTNTGASGTAAGTTHWSAAIPLLTGSNTITIRASDAAGNVTWRSAVVTRY